MAAAVRCGEPRGATAGIKPESWANRWSLPWTVSGAGRGTIRKRRSALRAGTGGPARPHVSHRSALVPVPDRPLGRREDLAAAAPVPLAQADARTDHAVRPRRRDPRQRRARDLAAAYRRRV